MTLQWLLGWWNLIFVVPFAIALTYLAAYVLTGVTFGDADAHGDAGADPDADAGHHGDLSSIEAAEQYEAMHGIDAAHDAGAPGDVHADAAHGAADHGVGHHADAHHAADHGHAHDHKEAGTHGRGGVSLMELLGVGRVPLSLMLMIALFAWGISGFAVTQRLHETIADGARVALYAVPIALVVTLVATALLTRALGRLMPMNEPASTSRRDLVGRTGVAVLTIGETFGLARVSPTDGSPGVQVPCRVAPGQPTIAASEAVVVLRFDRADQLFYVTTPDRLAALRAGLNGEREATPTAG